MRSALLVGFLVILFISIAIPISDQELADIYYQNASDHYSMTECKSASQYAELALNYYTKANDFEGKEKTLDLIPEINSCLMDQAYNYYYQAVDLYNQGDMDNSQIFVNRAKELYETIPYNDGIDRCNELIEEINEEVRKRTKQTADAMYHEAEDFLIEGDYLNAKDKAEGALQIYQEINESESVPFAERLLDRIEEEIEGIRGQAGWEYKKARELYQEEGYENYRDALSHAESARDMYLRIGDNEGYQKARDIIKAISDQLVKYREEQMKLANEYHTQAKTLYLLADYEPALENANNSKKIYQLFHDSTGSDQYLKNISQCDQLISKIIEAMAIENETERAESYYRKAHEFLALAKFENASDYATRAKEIFIAMGDKIRERKTNDLLEEIDAKLENKKEADLYYEKSDSYYRTADYTNASKYLSNATQIYSELGLVEGLNLSEKLNSSIQEGIAKKRTAEEYYDRAITSYNQNNYEGSSNLAMEAKELFIEINHSSGISKSEELIALNEKSITGVAFDPFRTGIGLVIIFTIIFILINWQREKRKREETGRKKMEEEKRKELERKTHEEEERKHREEEGIEKLEEERKLLKRTLREEKGVIREKPESKPEEKPPEKPVEPEEAKPEEKPPELEPEAEPKPEEKAPEEEPVPEKPELELELSRLEKELDELEKAKLELEPEKEKPAEEEPTEPEEEKPAPEPEPKPELEKPEPEPELEPEKPEPEKPEPEPEQEPEEISEKPRLGDETKLKQKLEEFRMKHPDLQKAVKEEEFKEPEREEKPDEERETLREIIKKEKEKIKKKSEEEI